MNHRRFFYALLFQEIKGGIYYLFSNSTKSLLVCPT